MAGLATAGVVYSIHSNFTPPTADIQGLPSGNADIDRAERSATWLSIGVVSGISLLAKDPTIFILGSVATVAMALFTRHATWTESASSLLQQAPGVSQATSANDLAAGPQMATTEATHMFAQSDFVT
jgi:hypothetical protein